MEYRVFGAALGLGIASAVQAGAGEPTLFGTVDFGAGPFALRRRIE